MHSVLLKADLEGV